MSLRARDRAEAPGDRAEAPGDRAEAPKGRTRAQAGRGAAASRPRIAPAGVLHALAAAASGGAGLVAQRMALTAGDLAAGAGAGAALVLGLWVAAWAAGAWMTGRSSLAPGPRLAGLGILAALGAVAVGGSVGSGSWVWPACLLCALAQGAFLPPLVRGGAAGVGLLWSASLLGGLLTLVGPAEAAAARAGTLGLTLTAAGAGLLASLLALAKGPAPRSEGQAPLGEPTGDALTLREGGLLVAVATAWTLVAEAVLLRLAALDLGAMHADRTAAFGAGLTSLGLGALLLPRLFPRGRRGPHLALGTSALAALAWSLPALHELAEELGGIPGALLLALPLAPLGAIVPLTHRAVAGERGRVLGDLLRAEVLGSLGLALPLLWWGMGPLGVSGLLAAPLIAAAALAFASRVRGPGLLSGLAAALLVALGAPSARTPALSRPEFEVLARAEGRAFAVTVVHDRVRDERTLLTDAFRATATGPDYAYMRALGHLPALLHPAPRRAAVLAFGTGTTAGAVARHPEVESLEILELAPEVLAQAHHFTAVNGGVLKDPRVAVQTGDGRHALARRAGAFDLITMEPLLPDAPGAVHLYTEEFYGLARRALAPGGVLCQWVPPHALPPATARAVVGAFAAAFPWSGIFQYGTQWVLVGADACPALDAARFPADGPLAEALAGLGLDSPAGLAARFVAEGAHLPPVDRPLTDRDPWIVHRPAARGAEVLSWLPANLAWLRGSGRGLPSPWLVLLDGAGHARVEGVAAVRRGREAYEGLRARDAGASDLGEARPSGRARDEALAEARTLCPGEPALAALEAELEGTGAVARGLGLLIGGQAKEALDPLSRAAELRPRLPVRHLQVALAAEAAGLGELALAALGEALRLCPPLLETRAGLRAASYAPEAFERLRERALASLAER
jgi:spermidine synthase